MGYTNTVTPSATNNILKFVEQELTPRHLVPEGFLSADDLVESFRREIPDADSLLEIARKDIADNYYSDINSFTSLRLKAGLSQRKLSAIVGTSQAHISKIEQGKNDPTLSTLRKLASAMQITIAELTEVMPVK